MFLPVSIMNEMSGSRFLLRGVGTQIMTASASRMRLKSLAEMVRAGAHHLRHRFSRDVFDVALSLVERIHFRPVHVKAQHANTRPGELK